MSYVVVVVVDETTPAKGRMTAQPSRRLRAKIKNRAEASTCSLPRSLSLSLTGAPRAGTSAKRAQKSKQTYLSECASDAARGKKTEARGSVFPKRGCVANFVPFSSCPDAARRLSGDVKVGSGLQILLLHHFRGS